MYAALLISVGQLARRGFLPRTRPILAGTDRRSIDVVVAGSLADVRRRAGSVRRGGRGGRRGIKPRRAVTNPEDLRVPIARGIRAAIDMAQTAGRHRDHAGRDGARAPEAGRRDARRGVRRIPAARSDRRQPHGRRAARDAARHDPDARGRQPAEGVLHRIRSAVRQHAVSGQGLSIARAGSDLRRATSLQARRRVSRRRRRRGRATSSRRSFATSARRWRCGRSATRCA